jgi:hypothetical protein
MAAYYPRDGVLCLLLPAGCGPVESPSGNRYPCWRHTGNYLQAAADMSQPYKGITSKLSFAYMPVSWPFVQADSSVNSELFSSACLCRLT